MQRKAGTWPAGDGVGGGAGHTGPRSWLWPHGAAFPGVRTYGAAVVGTRAAVTDAWTHGAVFMGIRTDRAAVNGRTGHCHGHKNTRSRSRGHKDVRVTVTGTRCCTQGPASGFLLHSLCPEQPMSASRPGRSLHLGTGLPLPRLCWSLGFHFPGPHEVSHHGETHSSPL